MIAGGFLKARTIPDCSGNLLLRTDLYRFFCHRECTSPDAYIVSNRIVMLGVYEPTSPYEVGEYNGRGGHDLYVDRKFIYVASGIKGLLILQFDESQDQ